jgi:hypothetical protein
MEMMDGFDFDKAIVKACLKLVVPFSEHFEIEGCHDA